MLDTLPQEVLWSEELTCGQGQRSLRSDPATQSTLCLGLSICNKRIRSSCLSSATSSGEGRQDMRLKRRHCNFPKGKKLILEQEQARHGGSHLRSQHSERLRQKNRCSLRSAETTQTDPVLRRKEQKVAKLADSLEIQTQKRASCGARQGKATAAKPKD